MAKTRDGERTPNTIHKAAGGQMRSALDDAQFRHGRDRHNGFKVGQFLQAPPFFYNADGMPQFLLDQYRGRSVFLICNGPSFGDDEKYPKDLLRLPGVMTMGVNNGPKVFRPDMWTVVDSPKGFMKSIWLDPKIMKFAPICHTQKEIRDNDSAVKNGTIFTDKERWENLKEKPIDCPNMVYYRRNDHFRAEQYLWEDTINWGNHGDNGGGRTVMLAAIRILYLLGFRRIFLLGVDFEMTKDKHYAFEQHRHKGSINGNNSTYQMMMTRFAKLKPYFQEEGLEIFNCNPDSALTVFEHVPFKDAIDMIQQEEMYGTDYANENTQGLYDTEYRQKERTKGKARSAEEKRLSREAKAAKALYSDDERKDAKERLDEARAALSDAKEAHQIAQQESAPNRHILQTREEEARKKFRRIEDEKRWKHGEPLKWGKLWIPDRRPNG